MELYKELLCAILATRKVQVTFPGLLLEPAELVDGFCYHILCKIKKVVQNGALDDVECFQRIEDIVEELETFGIDCGGRHDFG